jgi:hypothetical protein
VAIADNTLGILMSQNEETALRHGLETMIDMRRNHYLNWEKFPDENDRFAGGEKSQAFHQPII